MRGVELAPVGLRAVIGHRRPAEVQFVAAPVDGNTGIAPLGVRSARYRARPIGRRHAWRGGREVSFLPSERRRSAATFAGAPLENTDLVADESADHAVLLPRLEDFGFERVFPRVEISPQFADGPRYIGGVDRGRRQQPDGDESEEKMLHFGRVQPQPVSQFWNERTSPNGPATILRDALAREERSGSGTRTWRIREESRRIDQFKNFAVAAQPLDVTLLGTLGDFAQQFHRLRLIAGLAGIFHGHDHLDLHRDDISPLLNQALRFNRLPSIRISVHPSKK